MAKKTALILIFTLLFNFLGPFFTQADELEDVTKKLEAIKGEQAQLTSDIAKLSKDLGATQGQIDALSLRIQTTRDQIARVGLALEDRKVKLDKQVEIRNARVRGYYKKNQVNPITFLLGENSLAANAEALVYQQATMSETKHIIEGLNEEIGVFTKNKADLEDIKKAQEGNLSKLAALKNQLASQKNQAQSKMSGLDNEVKALSARQQQLLAEKIGSFTTSVGDVPPSDDDQHLVNPGFSPAFAAFSFGAPHRVGMSQYGAYGRSKAGQSAETILAAYYANTHLEKSYSAPGSIIVDGYGSMPFEESYLTGIGEVPSSWGDAGNGGMEALKAQAVASRSYALATTGNGASSICTTEACQVYIGHNKGGNWEQAVLATRNWVLVDNATNQPITAWFASTAGGITRSSADVWGSPRNWAQGMIDTTSGTIATWPTDAYEGTKYGRSPWFYKAWYKPRGGTGSRPHAWLNSSEMADILNCVLLYSLDSGTKTHLSQTDKPNGDTWSSSQVRDQLTSRGVTPINSVTSVGTVNYNQTGYTISIDFNTDQGSKIFNGGNFKEIFSIRAPGEIYLASSLYNVEVK